MVPLLGIEPRIEPYHGSVMPFNYKGNMGWSTRVELADIGSQPIIQTVGFKPPCGGSSE